MSRTLRIEYAGAVDRLKSGPGLRRTGLLR